MRREDQMRGYEETDRMALLDRPAEFPTCYAERGSPAHPPPSPVASDGEAMRREARRMVLALPRSVEDDTQE